MIKISLIKGDITQVTADAIVNAANNALAGGGGVDGAIHRAGGPEIMKECDRIRKTKGGCPTGHAVITTGGNLKAKYVIHAVGPIWAGGKKNEKELLSNAYLSSLKLAEINKFTSLAFPNISTGVYGFPKDKAAAIALKTVKEHERDLTHALEVIFVCFDDENFQIYKSLI